VNRRTPWGQGSIDEGLHTRGREHEGTVDTDEDVRTQRRLVREVGSDDLHGGREVRLARPARDRPDGAGAEAGVEQDGDEVTADSAGRAGDENGHEDLPGIGRRGGAAAVGIMLLLI
jgi:hypothetical protein